MRPMWENNKAETEGGIDAFEKAMMRRKYCILYSAEEQEMHGNPHLPLGACFGTRNFRLTFCPGDVLISRLDAYKEGTIQVKR